MNKINIGKGLIRNKDYIISVDVRSIPDGWEIDRWLNHIDEQGVVFWDSYPINRDDRIPKTLISGEPKIIFVNK